MGAGDGEVGARDRVNRAREHSWDYALSQGLLGPGGSLCRGNIKKKEAGVELPSLI